MTRFRKDDVEFHGDGMGRTVHAAVNVKVYRDIDSVLRDDRRLAEAIDGPEVVAPFRAWYGGLDDEDRERLLGYAWDSAIEQGWEQLNADAAAIFGYGYGVFSEGRSGGWAVVHLDRRSQFDRDDVAGWDAVAIAKWAKFARLARAAADDVPYQMVGYLYLNQYPPMIREPASRT